MKYYCDIYQLSVVTLLIQGVSKKTPVSGKMAITSLWKDLGAKVG